MADRTHSERINFGKLREVIQPPNLIEIQITSYLDFLQNRRSQTIVPPYSVRPVRGASVSMPLRWDELEDDELSPQRFTIHTAPPRVAAHGDLFRAALEDHQDLMPAIAALQDVLRSG